MSSNLDIFRSDFLGANSWAQRKDGVPLYLLDTLTIEELKVAEIELMKAASLSDTWPIIGLGHIKSQNALPLLYKLLSKSKKNTRITIAHAIFQIAQDQKMVDIVLDEIPKISNQYELIDMLYMLPDFQDPRLIELLKGFQEHKEYLVAYNATRALGLPTDEIVKKFRK